MVNADAIGSTDFSPNAVKKWFAPFDGADHIALGVSGGGDSVALMHLANRWHANNAHTKITVLTVDHKLRPEAAQEAAQVGAWAKAFGFVHVVLSWEGDKPMRGIQAAARDERYRLMLDWCAAHSVRHLGLAHNLDDQAETLLMRLARGSGLDGLSAMAPVSSRGAVQLVRPLLDVRGIDLRSLLKDAGHQWLEDPSNDDDRFERVRVRKQLERLGLDRAKLTLSARRLMRARQSLDIIAQEAFEKTVCLFDAGFCALDVENFNTLTPEVGLRVLKYCLITIGSAVLAPRLDVLETLFEEIYSGKLKARTLAGCKLTLKGKNILIAREPGRSGLPEIELVPDAHYVWDRRFDVGLRPIDAAPVMMRALKQDGRDVLKNNVILQKLPASIVGTLPSFWCEDRLLAVPHLDFYAKAGYIEQIDLRFCAAGKQAIVQDLTLQTLNMSGIFTNSR